jgi:hypothetical protein
VSRTILDDPVVEPPIEPNDTSSEPIETEPNNAGLYRVYPLMPTSDPDDMLDLEAVCDSPNLAQATQNSNPLSTFGIQSITAPISSIFAPFLNITVFRLMNWFYNGSSMKSVAELDRLVNDVILQPDFEKEHLTGFRAAREIERLDTENAQKDATFTAADGWRESSVKLRLPAEKVKFRSEDKASEFIVPGVFHRDIVDVIKSTFEDDVFLSFNTTPYKEYHQPSPEEDPRRVFGETYTADAYYEAWEEVQALPREPGDDLEHVVAGLMLWSDSTHLASFGNASLWPVYLYFANQSKYTRAKPTAFASHHLAYLPAV